MQESRLSGLTTRLRAGTAGAVICMLACISGKDASRNSRFESINVASLKYQRLVIFGNVIAELTNMVFQYFLRSRREYFLAIWLCSSTVTVISTLVQLDVRTTTGGRDGHGPLRAHKRPSSNIQIAARLPHENTSRSIIS